LPDFMAMVSSFTCWAVPVSKEVEPAMFGIRFGTLQFVTIFASSRTEVDVRPPAAIP
jgi:hypothetical protein